MVRAGETHHLVLTDGETEQGLILQPDGNRRLYVVERTPRLPAEELEVGQSSWHHGFGDYLYDPRDPNRYAYSDGIDARFANGLQLAPAIQTVGVPALSSGGDAITLPNADFSGTDETAWAVAASNNYTVPDFNDGVAGFNFNWEGDFDITEGQGEITHDATRTVSRSGQVSGYHDGYFKVATYNLGTKASLDLSDGGTISISFDVSQGYRWYAKIVETSDDGGLGASSSSSYLDGYTPLQNGANSVTAVVGAGTGNVYVAFAYHRRMRFNTYSLPPIDRSYLHIIPVSCFVDNFSVLEVGRGAISVVVFKGERYFAYNNRVFKLDEENAQFETVHTITTAGAVITDLAVHGDHIVVGFNKTSGGGYWYWDGEVDSDGVATGGTTKTTTYGVDLVASVQNDQGESILALTTLPNSIRLGSSNVATIPSNEVTVGNSAHAITAVHRAFDTILVGKEDGLYYWYPADATFVPGTASLDLLESGLNFRSGVEYIDGWFYVTTGTTGLRRMRFDPGGGAVFSEVAPRYTASSYRDYAGRVEALVSDGNYLYAAQATATDGRYHLLVGSYEESPNGLNLVWHSFHTHTLGGTLANLFLDKADGLLIVGQEPLQLLRMPIPPASRNPLDADTVNLVSSGSVVSPIFDFTEEGWAGSVKDYLRLGLLTQYLAEGQTLGVEYQVEGGIDDDGEWAAVGEALSTGDRHDVGLPVAAIGHRCRFRLTLSTDDVTKTPILRQYRVFAVPRPRQRRTWTMTAELGRGFLLNGAPSREKAATQLARLNTLKATENELLLYTEDDPDTGIPVRFLSLSDALQHDPFTAAENLSQEEPKRVANLQIQEVVRSV